MCDPVSAGILLAGALGSTWATNNQTKAQNRNMQAMQTAKENAFRDGIARQDSYAGDAQKAFAPVVSSQGSDGFNTAVTNGTANRMQAFTDSRLPNDDYTFLGSTPSNVVAAKEQAFTDTNNKADVNNAALARLSGYGDANFNVGLDRNNYARAFGNIADKAQRDASLIGLDMNQANNRAFKAPNQGLAMAKTASNAAMMYGAAGTPGLAYGEAPRPYAGYVGPQPAKFQFGYNVQ